MKRFLSTILLVNVCAVHAAPMEKLSNAVSDSDAVTFETLLQQNTLTKSETLELLNEASLQLKSCDKIYWYILNERARQARFALGVSAGFYLASGISSDDKISAAFAVVGVAWAGLAGYTMYDSNKTSTCLNKNYWRARAIQRLLFKKLLEAEFPADVQVTNKVAA